MNRKEHLLSLFDTSGKGLEIGPSFNPLLPRADGYSVEIIDCLSAAELRQKYADVPGLDLDKIEDVDYVCPEGSVFSTIGKENRYDFIVASHVIEHLCNPLRFFIDCQQLLKREGVLVLAIPDKRFSFDCLRPCTTTGQMLQAYMDERQQHLPGQVFDEIAYNCVRGGYVSWTAEDQAELSFFGTLEKAKSVFENLRNQKAINDIHSSQFTPSSFRLIINDLYEMGYISLRELKFEDRNGEFFVVLSQKGKKNRLSRMLLAKQIIAEQRSIHLGKYYSAPSGKTARFFKLVSKLRKIFRGRVNIT